MGLNGCGKGNKEKPRVLEWINAWDSTDCKENVEKETNEEEWRFIERFYIFKEFDFTHYILNSWFKPNCSNLFIFI